MSITTSDSDSSAPEETPVTYQTFFPGQIVIAREFPEGSLRVFLVFAFYLLLTCSAKGLPAVHLCSSKHCWVSKPRDNHLQDN